MRHLNPETLARLVDEPAGPEATEHLASCRACARELEALRDQREALASLPDLRPPSGDWADLEERLVQEGLVRASSETGSSPPVARSGWPLRAAASLVLFLGGVGAGAVGARTVGPAVPGAGPGSGEGGASVSQVATADAAADVLQEAEERYVSALLRYRELAADEEDAGDPASRYAALEALVAASQAAIRRAPTDPFINGVLVSTLAERQATLEQISTSNADDWF